MGWFVTAIAGSGTGLERWLEKCQFAKKRKTRRRKPAGVFASVKLFAVLLNEIGHAFQTGLDGFIRRGITETYVLAISFDALAKVNIR